LIKYSVNGVKVLVNYPAIKIALGEKQNGEDMRQMPRNLPVSGVYNLRLPVI
jgi:hypothetical protein